MYAQLKKFLFVDLIKIAEDGSYFQHKCTLKLLIMIEIKRSCPLSLEEI